MIEIRRRAVAKWHEGRPQVTRIRHLWRTREAAINPYGTFTCRCPWWLRLWYLVTGR